MLKHGKGKHGTKRKSPSSGFKRSTGKAQSSDREIESNGSGKVEDSSSLPESAYQTQSFPVIESNPKTSSASSKDVYFPEEQGIFGVFGIRRFYDEDRESVRMEFPASTIANELEDASGNSDKKNSAFATDASQPSAGEGFVSDLSTEGYGAQLGKSADEAPSKELSDSTESQPGFSASDQGKYSPTFEIKGAKKKPKNVKKIAIVCSSIVGGLAAVYLIGAVLFMNLFYPNTYIANIDMSMKSASGVENEINKNLEDYVINVKGQGMNLKLTSHDAGMKVDSQTVAETVRASQNPWLWPIEVFFTRDATDALANSMSATDLSDKLSAAVDEVNERAQLPQNAYVAFVPEKSVFEVVDEVPGNSLDKEKVLKEVALGAMNMTDNIILTKEQLLTPEVYSTDPKIESALKQANLLIANPIAINIDGTNIANLDAATMGTWVVIDDKYNAQIVDSALSEWANSIAGMCNTVGSKRTYTRPDGKVVTVSGGVYGWKIDNDALVAMVVEAVKNGKGGAIDIPVTQSGRGFTAIGSQDWGARYIDVDITEQHARFYGDDGTLIWETPIVTGAPGRDTPTGVYVLNAKESPSMLIGKMKDGKPEYERPVSYWMPFQGNSVGFHDATWQAAYGGQRYRQGHGSYGCVNMSLSAAKELYSLINYGDVVVVHY